MPRAPRKIKPSVTPTSSLLAALKFVSLAQKDEGRLYETHCILSNKTATAFNGVLSCGVGINEDLSICPHTLNLAAALARCDESMVFTQLDNQRLSIKSGNFKVVIPCASPIDLTVQQPDEPLLVINDTLKIGFELLSPIVSDTNEFVLTSAIYLQTNSMQSTNRQVMFEYWHGIDLPCGFVIPKIAAMAVLKSGKSLLKLGYSETTITFWFDDNSWLKTQLYNDKWPDFSSILNLPSRPIEVPLTLFKGFQAIIPFAKTSKVEIKEGQLSTDSEATYDIVGLPGGVSINYKYLMLLENVATHIDFDVSKRYLFFFGKNIRGAIAGMV